MVPLPTLAKENCTWWSKEHLIPDYCSGGQNHCHRVERLNSNPLEQKMIEFLGTRVNECYAPWRMVGWGAGGVGVVQCDQTTCVC